MALPKLKIDCWLHPGTLGRTEPTLCLFHESMELGAPILESLQHLTNEPGERSFSLAACRRKRAVSKLIVRLVPLTEELQVMNVQYSGDKATIDVTDEGLVLLCDAITKWLAGAEDFGVSPGNSRRKPKRLGKLDRESGELWFWGPHYSP